jgi:hypothetical protein
MAKRRWASQDDKRLKTRQYQKIVTHWKNYVAEMTRQGSAVYCEAPLCLLKGIPIRVGGTRTPAHLDVGHKIAREHDPRPRWTLADTRPEHARCNRVAGVAIREAKRATQPRVTTPAPLSINNNEW